MPYYTERYGMRGPVNKTSRISPQVYTLLLKCCEKYFNNIAWKYPEQCPDGYGCCGLNQELFDSDLKYEIPSLFRDNYGRVAVPTAPHNIFHNKSEYEGYDQYSLLDYLEFFAKNCRDVDIVGYHDFFRHHHLTYRNTSFIFKQFQDEINDIFRKTGLLYRLTDGKNIERIVEDTPLNAEIEKNIACIKEKGTRELLTEAINLFRQPYPESTRNAVEKIWDALERLKTYYTDLDKKASLSKIIDDMADGKENFVELFNAEFKVLTDIGNNYRIRHHETSKKDITDPRHYDYFFNRCLSLIALAIQYLH